MSNDHARTGSTDPVTRRLVGQPAPGETERTVGQLVLVAATVVTLLARPELLRVSDGVDATTVTVLGLVVGLVVVVHHAPPCPLFLNESSLVGDLSG